MRCPQESVSQPRLSLWKFSSFFFFFFPFQAKKNAFSTIPFSFPYSLPLLLRKRIFLFSPQSAFFTFLFFPPSFHYGVLSHTGCLACRSRVVHMLGLLLLSFGMAYYYILVMNDSLNRTWKAGTKIMLDCNLFRVGFLEIILKCT